MPKKLNRNFYTEQTYSIRFLQTKYEADMLAFPSFNFRINYLFILFKKYFMILYLFFFVNSIRYYEYYVVLI